MEFKKVKTALIGCGMISKTYLTNLKALDVIDLVGCSDIIESRAESRNSGIRKQGWTDGHTPGLCEHRADRHG